jgi:hypothetical protein
MLAFPTVDALIKGDQALYARCVDALTIAGDQTVAIRAQAHHSGIDSIKARQNAASVALVAIRALRAELRSGSRLIRRP